VFCLLTIVSVVGTVVLLILWGGDGDFSHGFFISIFSACMIYVFIIITNYFSDAYNYSEKIIPDIDNVSVISIESFDRYKCVYSKLKNNTDSYFLYYLNSEVRARIKIIDEAMKKRELASENNECDYVKSQGDNNPSKLKLGFITIIFD
jgi:hypothetical protein